MLDNEDTVYQILLAARNKNTQHKLVEAIEGAVRSNHIDRDSPQRIKYNCEIVLSQETPELSIADYLLWAIQRYILQDDNRFYKALESKYNLVIDLYAANGERCYNSNNRFEIEKVEEFRTDGYL